MERQNIKCLIVPDVHGRVFWKEPVNRVLGAGNGPVIFLGDYVDPYLHEWYDSAENVRRKAIEELKSIIALKKLYPKNVILLLGNHDCTYMIGKDICECRTDYENFNEIKEIFHNNRSLFQLAYELRTDGRHFIFSHAGIRREYAVSCFGDEVNEDNVVSLFNNAFTEDKTEVMNSLGIYSRYRGWSPFDYGSIVWADAREWAFNKPDETFGYNVVGHTMLMRPYIGEYMAFIDTQEVYAIDNSANIVKYNDLQEK